jgi:hypothetical protein
MGASDCHRRISSADLPQSRGEVVRKLLLTAPAGSLIGPTSFSTAVTAAVKLAATILANECELDTLTSS